jgi:hypothetical protein
MADLVSFDDAARELQTSTEEVTKLVSSGKLETAEEGGLLMVTRESLNAQKVRSQTTSLELSPEEPEAEVAPTIGLAADEASEEEAETPPAVAPEPAEEKTESIFGDEGFELETFEEVSETAAAPVDELGALEEAGEELGAEEMAELTAQAGAPARMRAVAARPETSGAVTTVVVITFLLLLFAGLVVFNFSRSAPQSILEPILESLPLGGE